MRPLLSALDSGELSLAREAGRLWLGAARGDELRSSHLFQQGNGTRNAAKGNGSNVSAGTVQIDMMRLLCPCNRIGQCRRIATRRDCAMSARVVTANCGGFH